MKTELEEAAEKFLIRQGCQRMDCGGENCDLFEDVEPKDLIEFTKWQQGRMYSEEEVLQLLLRLKQTESYDNLYDWFEQFKKK
jgi:hypothetical protein